MGLRQLYFMLHGLLDRLVFLSKGLAVILGFIAVKLLLHALHETTDLDVPVISTELSLGVIVVVLTVTAVASLIAVRRNPALVGTGPEADAERAAEARAGESLEELPPEEEPGEHPSVRGEALRRLPREPEQ
jgi:tellurite resistance protein TerC